MEHPTFNTTVNTTIRTSLENIRFKKDESGEHWAIKERSSCIRHETENERQGRTPRKRHDFSGGGHGKAERIRADESR